MVFVFALGSEIMATLFACRIFEGSDDYVAPCITSTGACYMPRTALVCQHAFVLLVALLLKRELTSARPVSGARMDADSNPRSALSVEEKRKMKMERRTSRELPLLVGTSIEPRCSYTLKV